MELTVQKPIFAESASNFVNKMSEFPDTILVKKEQWVVDAKSLLGVLAVSLQPGQQVTVEVQGDNEESIRQALIDTGLFTSAS